MIALISIVSLVVLIATIILVYKILVTSREVFLSEKITSVNFLKKGYLREKSMQQSVSLLHSKIKSLEDSNAYHQVQFSKWQMLLNSGQSIHSGIQIKKEPIAQIKGEAEEDWKEMYYQQNEQKVQMENELDEALQAIEKLSIRLSCQEQRRRNKAS